MSHLSYLCLCCLIISDFQQKYVVLKAMRRSGGISKNLLIKKLKSKMYVSFLICLYIWHWNFYVNYWTHIWDISFLPFEIYHMRSEFLFFCTILFLIWEYVHLPYISWYGMTCAYDYLVREVYSVECSLF